MGWKLNFQFSYQTFNIPYQTTHKSWTYITMKTNQKKEKKDERQNGKVLSPFHWFFISDSTTIKT